MKRIICTVMLCAIFILSSSAISVACGQKFLVKNRGVSKSQCYLTDKPGNILIYSSSGINNNASALNKNLHRALTGAEHNVIVVGTQDEFENAVKNDDFDLILCEYSAIEEVEISLREVENTVRILPAVDNENEKEKKSAKEKYGTVIKNSDRTSTKILTVNKVLRAIADGADLDA